MRILIQRVKKANVSNLKTKEERSIDKGIVVFVGIKKDEDEKKFNWLINKIINLRIFPSEKSEFDLSVKDINGWILVVSQFTLYGETKKGRRPDFTMAEEPSKAKKIYEKFFYQLKENYSKIKEGWFGEMMDVEILNWGPVTIFIDV